MRNGLGSCHQSADAYGQWWRPTYPKAYGFSTYPHYSSLENPNPAAFHPTPAGKTAIATKIEGVVNQLFQPWSS